MKKFFYHLFKLFPSLENASKRASKRLHFEKMGQKYESEPPESLPVVYDDDGLEPESKPKLG